MYLWVKDLTQLKGVYIMKHVISDVFIWKLMEKPITAHIVIENKWQNC